MAICDTCLESVAEEFGSEDMLAVQLLSFGY